MGISRVTGADNAQVDRAKERVRARVSSSRRPAPPRIAQKPRTVRFRLTFQIEVLLRFPFPHISPERPFALVLRVLRYFRGLAFTTSLLLASAAWHAIAAQPAPGPRHPALAADYGRLPLSFEENRGQAAPEVRFLSRGEGYSLFLSKTEAVLALRRDTSRAGRRSVLAAGGQPPKSGHISPMVDTIRMQLAGANPHVQVRAVDKLPGTANYFIGNNSLKWHPSVPTYKKINYRDIYPGIDLIYYGNRSQLEYDYIVAPGADPTKIRMRLRGVRKIHIDSNGDLRLVEADGAVIFHAPVVYQTNESGRHFVRGSFRLLSRSTVGFSIGPYDHARSVTIDPILAYSTYLGGSGQDLAHGIAVDASGAVYVVGETTSSDFPTVGPFQTSNEGNTNGASNVFISKFSPDGSALVYSTYLGGSGGAPGQGDIGTAIAVDSSGAAYVTGLTFSSNFPMMAPYQNANAAAANGLSTIFITKLNASGSALVFSTYLGGSSNIYSYDQGDSARAIAVDAAGGVYVAGTTYSADFPVTGNAFQKTNPGYALNSSVAFITKFTPNGHALTYSTYLGGSGIIGSSTNPDRYYFGDGASGIGIDKEGNAYVTGIASSTDFPVTPGSFQTVNNAADTHSSNAFVSKINSTGSALVYSTYLGGSSIPNPSENCEFCQNGDGGSGIAVGADGSAYVSGGTYSSNFPTTAGAFQTVNKATGSSASNAFAVKVNPTGTALEYSTLLGGTGGQGDVAYEVSIDHLGDAYLVGFSSSADFPVTPSAVQNSNNAAANGADNAFISVVNPTGTGLIYSSYLGGTGSKNVADGTSVGDVGYAIALDSSLNIYTAGSAASADFPTTSAAYQRRNHTAVASQTNAFVAKLGPVVFSSEIATTTTLSSSANPQTLGGPVKLAASVKPGSGNGIPTGTVTFTIDAGTGVPEALNSSGEATYSTSTLAAGSHTVVASYSGDSNYSISSGTLTETINSNVTAASITVVSGSGQTTSYGSAFAKPLLVIAKDASGNPVTGAVIMFSGAGLSFSSPSAVTGTNGQASVSVSATASGTLTATASTAGVSTPVTFSLTAGKASLTVKAVNVSVAYNQPIPALTYATVGFVNGDSSSVLTGSPSETSTAKQGSAPGTYPISITQGSLAAQNYTFQFMNGTLTINALGIAAAPTFSPGAGTYETAQTVTISDSTPGVAIYFTTDGTVPTSSSQQYSSAISVPSTETIEAFASAPGYSPSAVTVAAYNINLSPPGFTLAASATTARVSASQPAKITLNVTPENGFAKPIGFSCSGLPAGYLCTFSPASITPSGSPLSSILTIAASPTAHGGRFPIWIPLGSAPVFALLFWPFRRRRLTKSVALMLVVLVGAVALGCGSTSKSKQYAVTVAAAGGGVSQSTQVALTVSE